MLNKELKQYLDHKVALYNTADFIKNDPISIPHQFSKKQDIELAGFFAAILAWGNRTSIIKSCQRLLQMMGNAPHEFITQHQEHELKALLGFCHRTFNAHDLLYFIHFLRFHYTQSKSLEDAFVPAGSYSATDTGQALDHFYQYFFSLEHLPRTKKHIAAPSKKSACKRINMFLRWMVRKDDKGVDFGIWSKLAPSQLVCPLDVHVADVAYRLGLISSQKPDWNTAIELTSNLRQMNASDPAIYDFALFGIGAEERLKAR